MITSINTKHFYNRAGFGIPLEFLPVEKIDLKSSNSYKPLNIFEPNSEDKGLSNDRKMVSEKQKENRNNFLALNNAWFSQMSNHESAFTEKMTLFWHDHFACRSGNAYLGQQQINILKKNALGDFSKLLISVAKDPLMLQFLNNQKNKKDSPNENFAREVMELFTLGIGNYSESDVKNAASAFTGWGFDSKSGKFLILQRNHDEGIKIFRGKTGNFSGDDILHMILEDRQTARYISGKIVNYFAGSVSIDILDALATNFYESGYDIYSLMKNIYKSDWFYNKELIGNRIKSPIELIVGIQTQTKGEFANPLNITYLQKVLGQVLLQPPNVSGWPSGTDWIDSSSLALRMNLPSIMLNSSRIDLNAKNDGDVNNVVNNANSANKISFSVDFKLLTEKFNMGSEQSTLDTIEGYLMARPISQKSKSWVKERIGSLNKDEDFIKKAFIGFMSLPEYQLN